MSFIETTPVADATGIVKELYEEQSSGSGLVPNYSKVYCHNPALMTAWAGLLKELRTGLERRPFLLVNLAAARAINSSYCSLAFGRKLMETGISESQLLDILANKASAHISKEEAAMMRLARKAAMDPSGVIDEDYAELRVLAVSDSEIFHVIATASARVFFASVGDALGVQPDSPYLELNPQLRKALVTGRPIDSSEPEIVE